MEHEVAGTRVYFERFGSGDQKVLLLHGWGCEIKLMEPVAKGLSDHAEVLIPDFPAHGKSGRPPVPWGVPEYAECLRALLEKERFTPCMVVAHSFGARVAIWLASHDPELFTKVVLTGAAGLRKPQTADSQKKSDTYKRLRGFCDGMKKAHIFGSLPDMLQEKLVQKYGSADYKVLDPEMRKTFVKVISQDLSDCLPLIRQPVLLMWGENDDATPLWMGQKMQELIPDAGLVTMPGGSHFAYLEQIQFFNTVVHRFLLED